jgi:RNA recognition motif-containing protein
MKIFVGNLSFQATDSDLKKLFSQFGEVISAKVVTDNYTHRSRGFGFVEMANEHAEKAINDLNASSFMQQSLNVNEARERTSSNNEFKPRRF